MIRTYNCLSKLREEILQTKNIKTENDKMIYKLNYKKGWNETLSKVKDYNDSLSVYSINSNLKISCNSDYS